jgi:glycosyltransferase involved in cell wall biosynthesis
VKILWGSPLPPTRSGVSDYAVELLAELGKRAKIRVLAPPGGVRPETWTFGNGVEIVAADTLPETDEVSLIHLGNNPHHAGLLERLKGPNTVAVLHDLVLHHLLVEVSGGDSDALGAHLVKAHGDSGAVIARARRFGLTGPRDPFLFPARGALLDEVKGVIVHSKWAEGVITREFPGLPAAAVGLAVADPGRVLVAAERGRLGIAPDEVVLMHLGFLTPEKGLEQILTGLAAARKTGIPAHLVLVGEGRGIEEIRKAAATVGVGSLVSATGWVEPELFPAVPAAADLGVVMRTPSAGETSAAAIRFLATGTPVAVSGLHQFLEWPEEAAPRVTPGPSAPAELARLLVEAAQGGEGWDARRRAARAAYEEKHRPADAAEAIVDFLDSLAPTK